MLVGEGSLAEWEAIEDRSCGWDGQVCLPTAARTAATSVRSAFCDRCMGLMVSYQGSAFDEQRCRGGSYQRSGTQNESCTVDDEVAA